MSDTVESVLVDPDEGAWTLVLSTVESGEHRFRLPVDAALGLLLEADRKVGPYAAEIPGNWHRMASVG